MLVEQKSLTYYIYIKRSIIYEFVNRLNNDCDTVMTISPNELREKLKGPVVAMTTHVKDDSSLDLDAMRVRT